MNGTYGPTYSTNNLWVDDDVETCLTTYLEDIESDIAALETGKANSNHTHDSYASTTHTHSYNDLTDKPTIGESPQYSETSIYCNGVLSGNVLAVKYGRVVTLYASSLNSGSTGLTTGGNIGTLPAEYRPQYTNCFYIGNGVWSATLMIWGNGDMNITLGSGNIIPNQNAMFTCTYVI